jgi:membrane protease YdiL (CAAX protease family)
VTGRPGRAWFVLLAGSFEGGLGLVAWWLGWLLGEPLEGSAWWDPSDAAWGAAASLPMLAVFWLGLRLRLPALARIRRLCDEIIRPLFAPCTLAELALLSLLAGAGEEALFRGVLQAALARRLGPWAAVVLVGLAFGLAHAITPTYALFAALLGVYLGAVGLAAGNLLVVVVAHALYDFAALVYLTRGPALHTGA